MKSFGRSHLWLWVAPLAWLWVAACSSAPIVPPDSQMPSKETYVIGAMDQIAVSVWKNPELSLTVPVRIDGKISLPLLDDVQAEGLTPEELKEVVTQLLGEFVSAPDVTVIVLGMNSKSVSMMGEGIVRKGPIQLRRDTTILEAIAQSGGFTVYANSKKVLVLRKTDEGLVEYRFNYDAYISGKAPDSNFLLKPGDTILVSD
ncbi:MAG: polysaccharide biosynthesis/export family protein [SAR324 cluster bacterium]|nr:polysaccharide biosynthesis/export family protein [SAR324 cluster bacterium]